MAIICEQKTDTYCFAEKQHKRWDVLKFFKVRWGTADEIRKMLAEVHQEYYGKPATHQDLWVWGNRYMGAQKELPTSVLSLYCRKNGLIPLELATVG